jgi:hypothetical protein
MIKRIGLFFTTLTVLTILLTFSPSAPSMAFRFQGLPGDTDYITFQGLPGDTDYMAAIQKASTIEDAVPPSGL